MDGFKNRSRKLARESYWEKHDRDTYECPDCGRTEKEIKGRFEVHHKNGEPMDNRPKNQVGLCRVCHNLREEKKPSIEEIRNLRDGVSEQTQDPVANSDVSPISLISEYQGDYGAIVCPGCGKLLGVAESDAEIRFDHACCGVSAPEIPTVAVIDHDLREMLPEPDDDSHWRVQRGVLRQWMVSQWVKAAEERRSVTTTEAHIQGWEDGEAVFQTEEVQVDMSGILLVNVELVADTWGWDEVAYEAEKAKESPEPALEFKNRLERGGHYDADDPVNIDLLGSKEATEDD